MAISKLLLSMLLTQRRLPRSVPQFPCFTICFHHLSSSPYLQYHNHLHITITAPYHNHSLQLPQLSTPSHHHSSALSTFYPIGLSTFFFSRAFSTGDSILGGLVHDSASTQSQVSVDLASVKGGIQGPDITEAAASVSSGGGESIVPVRALISLLDGYHDLTGLPWWIIIASSTLALRIVLLPIFIVQLKKLKQIAELLPKLPPPFPRPLSGKKYTDQLLLFWKEKRAIGCPSLLWPLASVSIQLPCFLLGMTSIRRMSLDHHTGFDCGGTLWFQNLTEYPHGVLSPIFPVLISGLQLINVQVSLWGSSVGKGDDVLALLGKYYKDYLNFFLPLIIFVAGFSLPQGSLVYWLTNSSFTLIQQLFLRHPDIRMLLGLPDKRNPMAAAKPEETRTIQPASLDLPKKQQKISVHTLSPQELVILSIKHLAEGRTDRAIPLLRLSLEKDPECVRALVVMGQTLLQQQQLAEATEHLDRAIAKILPIRHPKSVEDVNNLILASQWAGVACIRQGKKLEGIAHLERIAGLEEPEDPKSKAHYYDGLLLLASALYDEGRKVEAVKYMRMAAAYDPAYNVYLEQCEK